MYVLIQRSITLHILDIIKTADAVYVPFHSMIEEHTSQ